tara:strand:+ start:6682 stop:6900 length:219 start_codon:yes stop_codon:yes gene_type:complete
MFEISNPSTGYVYDNRVTLDKALSMIAGSKDENEQELSALKEESEVECRSRHIPSFKLTLKKVSLSELIHTE